LAAELIGDVLDRAWFDATVVDVTRRAAAEAHRLEKKRIRAATAHERVYGRPYEVRDPAGLVQRFGMKVPLGYLVHATQYAPITRPIPTRRSPSDGATGARMK
jgi:hypothetical protein